MKEVLGLGSREHVALVGAGGKTSLMAALARELHGSGRRVVTSTTTKVWYREALGAPCIIFVDEDHSWKDSLRTGLASHGHVFLGKGLLESGKVQGISTALLDEVFLDQDMDCLIVEADGAAGHPVKAPDVHEPVIPKSATAVVAMAGLEAMGQPVGPETVFRSDIFCRLTGAKPGQVLTGTVLARLFAAAEGVFKGTPDAAQRIVFLNKADLLDHMAEALDLAALIRKKASPPVERLVVGSLITGTYHAVFSMSENETMK